MRYPTLSLFHLAHMAYMSSSSSECISCQSCQTYAAFALLQGTYNLIVSSSSLPHFHFVWIVLSFRK